MAHVHEECLREWRKQSANPRSLYTCDACGYAYRTQRTAAAAWLQRVGCGLGWGLV
jgi:ribosomal protein L37AE/L43A